MNIAIIKYLAILYFISEFLLLIFKRSSSDNSKVKIKNDKLSLIVLWITIFVTITSAFFTAKWKMWDKTNIIIAYIATILILIGAFIRWSAILQLKKEFTVDVAIVKEHKLRTEGIYKHIRHPSYSGLFLICIGISLGMNSVISFLIITIPLFTAISFRIKVEEVTLTKEFGSLYSDYTKKTKKIIPGIY